MVICYQVKWNENKTERFFQICDSAGLFLCPFLSKGEREAFFRPNRAFSTGKGNGEGTGLFPQGKEREGTGFFHRERNGEKPGFFHWERNGEEPLLSGGEGMGLESVFRQKGMEPQPGFGFRPFAVGKAVFLWKS